MSKQVTPLSARRDRGRIGIQGLTAVAAVDRSQLVRAVRAALGDAPFRSIHVALVDEARMDDLHRQFMGQPGPTDVLTFDLRDRADQPEIEGEIVVCADVARRQARTWRADLAQELLRYVVHGVLHLKGYDDDTAAKRRRMRCEENRVLALLRQSGVRPPKRRQRRVSPARRDASGSRAGSAARRRSGRHV